MELHLCSYHDLFMCLSQELYLFLYVYFYFYSISICGDEGEGLIKCRVFRDPDNTSGGHGWSVRYTQVGQRVFFHFSLYSSIYTFCLFYKAFIFLFFSLMFLGNLVSPFNWEIILIILICNFSFFNCSHIIKSAIDQPTL